VLVTGKGELLAERAVARVVRLAREGAPDAELTRLDAATCRGGELRTAAGASLFSDAAIVVAAGIGEASEEFLADALEYVAAPEPASVVVLWHGGGPRGRKLLEAVRAAGHSEVACPELTREADKMGFASAEFRRMGRQVTADALRALMDAVGSDLRELASSINQLTADTRGRITRADVDKYYGGRVEASGFKVADSAVIGDVGTALTLARHAMATGTDPVALVGALAGKLRTMAKVGGARRRGLDPTRDLGIPGWQVDRARRELRGWQADGLGRAIRAVALADSQVKGAGKDPGFAVERAVIAVASEARAGRGDGAERQGMPRG
jgi:DNA polymerase-3 subunit delta